MKTIHVMMLLAAVALHAAAQTGTEDEDVPQPVTYVQKVVPQGIDNYQAGFYYYNGKSVYNMRSYAIASGTEIGSLKVNPAGSSYAYIDTKKERSTVHVNDLWTAKKELGEIKDDNFNATAIAYSADSKRLYVGCSDDTLRIYDSKSFIKNRQLPLTLTALRLDASANGYFLVASNANTATVMNIETGNVRKALTYNADIKDIAFSANSALMAVLTADGKCYIYDTKSFELTHNYEAMGTAEGCFFHPENKYLAVVTGDSRIAIVNILNEKDRDYVDATETGITYVSFVKNTDEGIYLVYNTASSIVFYPMFELTPNRQQLLRNELAERMEEWTKRMDGESLEDYNNRVNDETRMAQISLFEMEIATRMADNLLSMSEISLGSYNQEMGVLTLDFDNMPSIYLSVAASELTDFMDVNALQFTNSKYCINANDEFELVYTEVVNTKNGQTYIFDNTERKSLAFLESDDSFIPLSQMQMSQMEEMKLEEIRNNIMTAARDKNIISDHTNIDVSTKIVTDYDADGKRIMNYEVGVSYTVDQEYSAKDDFASGKFKTEESAAAVAMLNVVKEALEGDLSKYVVNGKQVKVMVSGTADATPFRSTMAYDGTYGDYEREPVYKGAQLTNITVTKATGISDNDQLAFLRAMGVKNYMVKNIPSLSTMKATYDASIEVSEKAGSQYRRIGVQLTFIDAF